MCPFPSINFASFVNPAMMDWAARRGRLYPLCRTRNSITGVSIYFNYRVAQPPLACPCVYGSPSGALPPARPERYYYRIPPGCGIASRFNWTPRASLRHRAVSAIPTAHSSAILARVYASIPRYFVSLGVSTAYAWLHIAPCPHNRIAHVLKRGICSFIGDFDWLLINFVPLLNQHRAFGASTDM